MRKYTSVLLALMLLALSIMVIGPSKTQAQAAWAPNVAYKIGDLVTYGGSVYKCIQAHTSQVGWEPPNVPALWTLQSGTVAPTTPPTTAPTKTNTPGTGPTATKTNTPKPTNTTAATTVPSATPNGSGCWTPYVPGNIYTGGMTVSYNGHNWTAKWWTQNEAPSTGGSGVWQDNGSCATGPTNTPTFVPSATKTNTPGGPTNTPMPTGGNFTSHYYAPYIDVSIESDLTNIANTTGSKFFTLAFIVDSGSSCQAEWGGTSNTMSSSFLVAELSNLRAAGGDVVVSFGGAAGNELALDCSSVSALQAQYQAVISKYNLTHVDFDVEGSALDNTTANNRRNQALHNLQAANPGLLISYTLPVDTTGILSNSISLLNNSVSNSVNINVIDLMTMDYGRNLTDMGSAATQATDNTVSQLASIFTGKSSAQLYAMMGITPMIGVNDTNPETFTLANASTVLSYAQMHNVAMIGMWSMNRDHQCPSGTAQPADTCSGVSQSNYQFSTTWKALNH